jgi:hypothetical protein
MNKIFKQITVAVLAVTLIFGFTGCSTTAPNNATTMAAITVATAIGAQTYIQSNPKTLPDFVVAEQALYTISTGTNDVTVNSVETALKANGGNVNPVVSIAIVDGINLADSYLQNSGTNSAAIKQVSFAVATGLAQAVQSYSTNATIQYKAANKK